MMLEKQQPWQQTDVVIVGGGMVGLSLALLLTRRLPDVTISVIEAFAPPQGQTEVQFRPSFDARSTALSRSSREVFTRIGLWPQLAEHLTSIRKIHVSDRGHIGSTMLTAEEEHMQALGYVVENQWLGQVLQAAVGACARIRMIAPASPASLTPGRGAMEVVLDNGDKLKTPLLVVADGARSSACQQLGICQSQTNYGQEAIIANVVTAKPHQDTAFERFTDEGPLALLPLEPFEGNSRSALIWTLPPERAKELLTKDKADFITVLQQRFGNRLGEITSVGERHSFPLKLVTADELVRRNVALVGNAASALHPVAGQGFNLALRGISVLVDTLVRSQKDGASLGELSRLMEYANAHQRDRQATITFSDSLPKLFGHASKPIALGRNIGLLALDAIPSLRSKFSLLGTGLAGRQVS